MKAPKYPYPKDGYLKKPEDQSCYEYMLECYEKIRKDHGEYTAFVNLDCKTSMADMIADIEKLAAFLHQNGFKKGDTISVFLPTSAHAIVAFYALNKLGIIVNMVHPLLPPGALSEVIEITKSKALFILDRASGAYADIVKDIFTIVCSTSDYTSGAIKPYVMADDAKNSNIPVFDTVHLYRDIMAGDYENAETVTGLGKETMIYLNGGGTTGRSKFIKHSSYSLNYFAYAYYLLDHDHKYGDSYTLCVLPCFHAFGLGGSIHYAMCNSYSAILMPKFDAVKANEYISRYNVHEILGVPSMFKKLIGAPNFDGNPGIKNLTYISCGGDSVTKEFIEEFSNSVHKNGGTAELLPGYGLTEMCADGTANTLYYNKPGSVGKPLESIELTIRDENKNEVPAGVIGEIVLHGEMMMNGYLDDGYTHTDGFWTDENGKKWVCTGDAGYLDEDGFLFFAGRIKRIIVISGYNIYPASIEEKVMRIGFINEICAVQGYDGNNKPLVKLCVSLNEDAPEDAEDKIMAYCRHHLDHFSIPRKIEFFDALPHTKMDKIDFLKLTEKPLATV